MGRRYELGAHRTGVEDGHGDKGIKNASKREIEGCHTPWNSTWHDKERNQEVADRTESKIREPETGNYHKEKRWNFKSTLKKV